MIIDKTNIKRNINLIVIHCSATDPSKSNYGPERLRRDHIARGFSDCGYHYYIAKDGEIHAMRPLEKIGAHAKGYNQNSIGVCYEGGIRDGKPADTRTDAQRESLTALLVALVSAFPGSKIVGHRDLSPDLNGDGIVEPNEWIKSCPCFDATKEYRNI